MARPTKMTPEVVKRIVDALAAGNTRRAASAYGGIDEDTLGRWLRRFADFADAIKAAEAQAEVAHVANIAQAAKDGTWQASAWWLERRQHAAWGKVDRVEIEIRRAAERVAQQTGADPEWLVKRAAEIVAASDGERPS
jgi:transposase